MMINYRYCMTSIDVTSVSYKRQSLAAVSPVAARLVWPTESVILDGEGSNLWDSGWFLLTTVMCVCLRFIVEIERLKDERNTPLFAKVFRAGEVISARGSLPTAVYFIAYVASSSCCLPLSE
jgi:malonyl-CoA decarboxylase